MSSVVLRGKVVAEAIEKRLQAKIVENKLSLELVIVMVGDNAASKTYVQKKQEACARIGIRSRLLQLAPTITQEALHEHLKVLNNDAAVTGYIVQLPLPDHLSIQAATRLIPPEKDVDGFTAESAGRLFLGRPANTYLPSATAHAVMELLDGYDISVAGKHVVIVGRSNLVGKPLAIEMLARDATVTLCHSKTEDLAAFTRKADILVSAAGKPHLIKQDMIQEGAILVDVGFHKNEHGLFGDIDPACFSLSAAHAPVPGGVGPVTVAQLLANVVHAHSIEA